MGVHGMEGLIPFIIHAIKKSRDRRGYRCLSDGSTGRGGNSRKALVADWQQESSSHHRRTRSNFPPLTIGSEYLLSSDTHFALSLSLREDALRK